MDICADFTQQEREERNMGIFSRIKREFFIRPWLGQGYSRRLANSYYKKVCIDLENDNGVSKEDKKWAHAHKYFSDSIEKYDLKNNPDKYITDMDYMYLKPFNNSFTKWVGDLVTENLVLIDYREHLPKLYFNIIERENRKVFLPIDTVGREYGENYDDFIKLLDERGELVIRPDRTSAHRSAYRIKRTGEDSYELLEDSACRMRMSIYGNDYDRDLLLAEEHPNDLPENFELNPCRSDHYDKKSLYELISTFKYSYVIAEPYRVRADKTGMLRIYVANEKLKDTKLLDYYYTDIVDGNVRCRAVTPDGALDGEKLGGWDKIIAAVTDIAHFISEIEYFTVSIFFTEDGFVIDSIDTNPSLPPIVHSDALNDYLLARLAKKRETVVVTRERWIKAFSEKRFKRFVKRFCRPGIRPYMQRLWMNSVWDDLWHNKATTLRQKLWSYKRGFLSFRIKQYGLTKDNYKNFLSDYQYHWLNRINNGYQIWINDKTTTRYVFEPYKQYLAKYYYDIIKIEGETCIKALQDIPDGFEASFDGIFRLLRQEKLLALKPSAGTHGDGFYRMEYADGKYFINGNEMTEDGIIAMIDGFKSIYIITEYLFMHRELKKIYPHSVNTIRVAVVNQSAYEPKIMQTYMRIGSSKSGFTDNVGYGGICAKIDIPTGRYYCAEQLKDHVFTPCPIHPDTGVEIEGVVPNWELMKKGIIDICRFMPELEYLGFDIAITDDGFKIIEINIHQDLHKVAEHSEEFKSFYRDKLRLKAEKYGLNKW